MEAIILIGIQASGKSTFYKTRFFNSHVRLSLDLLNTRNKFDIFLKSCLQTQSRFVVDNTNPTRVERAKIIRLAKERKYHIIGYYFNSSLAPALERNQKRTGKSRIPDLGIKACHAKLEVPSIEEGFDTLYYVQLQNDDFLIQPWKDEI